MNNLFSHHYRACGIGVASCVPSRLVFDRGALPGGPGVSEGDGDVVADASEPVDEAAKLDTAAELAKLKETIDTAKDNVKKIAAAIGEDEAAVKQAILRYDLAKHAKALPSPKQAIINKIKNAIRDGRLKTSDIMFYGGTDGTRFNLGKVLGKGQSWHNENIQAFNQLIALGNRLHPKKARDLRDTYLAEIKLYMGKKNLAGRRQVLRDHSGIFLPGGGLFDLALALKRAKHAQKELSNGAYAFDSSSQEVFLDLRDITYVGEDFRKSGIWAIGEVAEEDSSHNYPGGEPEEKEEKPPEEKKEEVPPPEPPKPEPKKQEPPPPEKIDTYPDIVAQLDLRQIMENARHSPGEKAWVYFGGPLKEKMPAGPKAYIMYDQAGDRFRYGFDNVPGSLEYREIVAPAENMTDGKGDTWGRGGRWSYRERIDSVEQKAFKVKLSHFIAEEMKRRGLDPKVVKVNVTADGSVVGAPPRSPAEQAAVKASVEAASELASERVRLDGELEKLNKELAALGVDARDLDISSIQRTAKNNPGAAAVIYLRGELGKKMPLSMKAFVTYNSAESVFEYRFDNSGKEKPDETDAGASVAQKEADLAGMKFLVRLAKKILGK